MARLLPPEWDFGVLPSPRRPISALVGAFVALLLAFALIERIGFGRGFVTVAVIAVALAFLALIALLAHGRRAIDYYVGERRVTGPFGGIASAGVFAGVLAVGLLGGGFASRQAFIAAAAGFALGFLLLALFGAMPLRRLGVYTVGDFLARRFENIWVRLAAAAVAFVASFLLLLAHLKIASTLLADLTGLELRPALLLAALLTALPVLAGGIRSVTWTQAVQYLVVLLACLAPAAYLSAEGAASVLTGGLGELLRGSPESTEVTSELTITLLFMALAGASLPYLTARALAAPSARAAAISLFWGALFSVALLMAALVFWQVLASTGEAPAEALSGGDLLQLAALFATLPAVLSGLAAAGALAALLALGQAALFSATTAIARDFMEVVDPEGPETLRIVLSRIVVVIVATAAIMLLSVWRVDAVGLLQWGLAFAVAGGLAPLLLALRWRRCNDVGALAGIIVGFGFATIVFLGERRLIGTAGELGALGAPIAAIAGAVAALAAAILLSLVMPNEKTPAAHSHAKSDALPQAAPEQAS